MRPRLRHKTAWTALGFFLGLAFLTRVFLKSPPRPDPVAPPAARLPDPPPPAEPESPVRPLDARDAASLVMGTADTAAPEPPQAAVPLFRGRPAGPGQRSRAPDEITPLNLRDPAALVMGVAPPQTGLQRVLPRRHPMDDTGTARPADSPFPFAPGQPPGEGPDVITPLDAHDPSDLVSGPAEPETPAARRERLRREAARAKASRR